MKEENKASLDTVRATVVKVICTVQKIRSLPKDNDQTETLLNTTIGEIINDASYSVKKRRMENFRLALRKYLKDDCGIKSPVTSAWIMENQEKTLNFLIKYIMEKSK